MTKARTFITALLLLALAAVLVALYTELRPDSIAEKRIQVAREIGGDALLVARANPENFPVRYFQDRLRPGMTPDEVHSTVKGYEQVLHCAAEREIYYYFSLKDRDAVCFQVRYGADGRYTTLTTEDITTQGCIGGPIKPPAAGTQPPGQNQPQKGTD